MQKSKIIGAAAATLAFMLLAAQPATAAPAEIATPASTLNASSVTATDDPAAARSAVPGATEPAALALPSYCAGGTVRTYAQVGSTQRRTASWGNIALDLNSDTGISGCSGVWPGGTLYVAAARCSDGSRFSAWRAFTYPQRKDIATDVLPNTCYRLTWYGTGGNDGNYFQGRVIWPQ